jgi:hypothetical protein
MYDYILLRLYTVLYIVLYGYLYVILHFLIKRDRWGGGGGEEGVMDPVNIMAPFCSIILPNLFLSFSFKAHSQSLLFLQALYNLHVAQ